ncbi:MAG: biofilm-associated protein [Nitrosopumilaceae archaeon]
MVTTIFTLTATPELFAQSQSVTAKSISFEETTIIEFQNNDNTADINTFRVWLGSDFNFKSFKTERGWTGEKTSQGVIIFTSSTPLDTGEIVKFGIKTDKPKPGINWRALANNDQEIAVGKTLVSDSPPPVKSTVKTPSDGSGVLKDSTFRLIPEKPSVGSSIRVTGDNFGANTNLDFYIGTKKLQSFETDDNGHFIITSAIPEDLSEDRVDFKIKDSEGNEKAISLRLGAESDKMVSSEIVPLTMSPTPTIVYRGNTVTVTGTGTPGSTVTATIKNENDEVRTSLAVPVNSDGKWTLNRVVPIDTPFGTYTAEISDGTNIIKRTWVVESSQQIQINPTQLKFDPGETITFNGTAKPNVDLEIVVEDPQGTEFYTEVMTVGASGEVNISVDTIPSDVEGTYVLFATQGDDTGIVLVGLGELPEVKLIAKTDKLNYSQGGTVMIEIQGPPSSTLSLLIADPSDKKKFADTIVLGPEGRMDYELDLTGYTSGVYTAVLSRGNSQINEVFSVGLQTGSGEISVRTTKDTYHPGDSILVLGETSKNVLLTLELRDPDGNIVKSKETFTNKDGVFSLETFRIPLDAQIGIWTVHAKSGANFDDAELTVQGDLDEGIVVFVDDIVASPGGKIVTIKGYGAKVSQQVIITVFSENAEQITKLTIFSTQEGDFSTIWLADSKIPPGTYTIKVKDAVHEAQTTVVLK